MYIVHIYKTGPQLWLKCTHKTNKQQNSRCKTAHDGQHVCFTVAVLRLDRTSVRRTDRNTERQTEQRTDKGKHIPPLSMLFMTS